MGKVRTGLAVAVVALGTFVGGGSAGAASKVALCHWTGEVTSEPAHWEVRKVAAADVAFYLDGPTGWAPMRANGKCPKQPPAYAR